MAENEVHGCIAAIVERFDGPFEKPISFSPKGEMSADKWMIKVYKLTKSGNISRSGGGHIGIVYCPLCGERLVPEEKPDGEV